MTERRAALMVFLAGLSWSFTGVLIKFSTWSAYTLVGARALVSLVLLGLCRRSFRIPRSGAAWVGALALMGTSALFMMANKLTSASNAIVLQYAMPIFVVLYSAVVLKVKPSRVEVLTVLLVLAGVALCFAQGLGGGHLAGDALALLSALTYTVVFFVARLTGCDPFDYTYLGSILSCLFLLYAPFDAGFALTAQNVFSGLAMGLGLGLGYMFFSFGMKQKLSPIKAAVIANAEPVLSPVWAFLILGENPGLLSILGAAVVLLAVTAFTVLSGRKHDNARQTEG